jgi:hypothetical protein
MGKIQINFTAPSPAPANGYRVKYKKSTDSTYLTVSPNPTSSPVIISSVENGVSYNVTVESDCGGGTFSTLLNTTAVPAKTFFTCPANMTGNNAANTSFTYPDKYVDVFNPAISLLTLNYNAYDRPNRFTVYDENGNFVISTGWVGQATYSGPWGPSSTVPAVGQISFNRDPGVTYYTVRVEVAGGNPANPTSDSWEVQISCS